MTLPDTFEQSKAVDDQTYGVEHGVSKLSLNGKVGDIAACLAAQETVTPKTEEPSSEKKWLDTITRCVKSVVSINFIHLRNFDYEETNSAEATGFIVDAERGIILTNRHIVCPGPFYGYAVFDNYEEAALKPIFRDPIHDFGFLQFDPKEIKHMELKALELKPELAQVGTEIRVVGNDNGDKLSILAGFISRVDRNPPRYDPFTPDDVNTEYIQAAASASGGSSGSPVINSEGDAVAIQAGGACDASTDYFLPVSRPLRALKCIQQGMPITRGDIQVKWYLRSYGECKRLGLSDEAETRARKAFPSRSGMVVADLVIPESPVENVIKEGDILISIEGELIPTQIRIDEILDENVGRTLKFVLQRGKGEYFEANILIGDVNDIMPSKYVEVINNTFTDISYSIALCRGIPIRGVTSCDYINQSLCDSIIVSIDDVPTPNLDAFIAAMQKIPDRKQVNICYKGINIRKGLEYTTLTIDKHWNPEFRLATRNDSTGFWDFKDLMEGIEVPTLPEPVPQDGKFLDFDSCNDSDDDEIDDPIHKIKADKKKRLFSKLVNSSVEVTSFYGDAKNASPSRKEENSYGFVIDAKYGYVIVSRSNVQYDTARIVLTFAGSIEVFAKVVFLHPFHYYAIVKYDPKLVLADVRSLEFASKALKKGNRCFLFGYKDMQRVNGEEVIISDVKAMSEAGKSYVETRCINMQAIYVDTTLDIDDGLLADEDGTIRGFWFHFRYSEDLGLDVVDVLDVIRELQENKVPKDLRIIEAEFLPISRKRAKTRGVPQEWIAKLKDKSSDHLLEVNKVFAFINPDSEKKCQLQNGDILLTVNDTFVGSMRDLSIMYKLEFLNFKIIRDRKEMDLLVHTVDTKNLDPSRIIYWCGARIRAPTFSLRQDEEYLPSGVSVDGLMRGTNASLYCLPDYGYITEVNDQETRDLDAFIQAVSSIPDETFVKLKTVEAHVPDTVSVKTLYHYFPTTEFRKDEENEWNLVKPGM